jgi:hypothetical protein
MSEGARPDWLGRGIGLAVFAGGIVLLILVFIRANQLPHLVPPPGPKSAADWSWAIRLGVQTVQLFVSGMVASWIAGRGAQLYAASNRALSGDS